MVNVSDKIKDEVALKINGFTEMRATPYSALVSFPQHMAIWEHISGPMAATVAAYKERL